MSSAHAIQARRRAEVKRWLEHAWFVVVVVYALVRIVLADRFLTKYGLPIKPFAIIEILSSMIYALASARFVGALVDDHNRRAGFFGLCSLVGFGAPDVFVIVASDHIPRSIFIVLALIVLGTVIFTVRELRAKMRRAKFQHSVHEAAIAKQRRIEVLLNGGEPHES
jgi:asparagine N-glycosylation enzyme membrane subunit Stt3